MANQPDMSGFISAALAESDKGIKQLDIQREWDPTERKLKKERGTDLTRLLELINPVIEKINKNVGRNVFMPHIDNKGTPELSLWHFPDPDKKRVFYDRHFLVISASETLDRSTLPAREYNVRKGYRYYDTSLGDVDIPTPGYDQNDETNVLSTIAEWMAKREPGAMAKALKTPGGEKPVADHQPAL